MAEGLRPRGTGVYGCLCAAPGVLRRRPPPRLTAQRRGEGGDVEGSGAASGELPVPGGTSNASPAVSS